MLKHKHYQNTTLAVIGTVFVLLTAAVFLAGGATPNTAPQTTGDPTGITLGASNTTFQKHILPVDDSTYDLGSASKAWLHGYFDEICLTADTCETAWPSGGSGNVSTSTGETAGNLAYWTSTNGTPALLGKVATSSPTFSSPLTTSGTAGFLVGGSALTIGLDTSGSWTGLAGTATALAANGANCAAGNYPLGVDASGAVEDCTAAGGGSGTVTSVAATVPTGLSISGSPVTTAGTLAFTWTAGYAGMLTASSTNWNLAYDSWNTNGTNWTTAYTNRITSATYPLSIASNVLSSATSSASSAGVLSAADWTTFNGKLSAVTADSPLSGSGTSASHLVLSTAGTWAGNAGTATALAANGANCTAGNYPLGVDASGAVEGCTAAGTGTVTSVTGTYPIISSGGATPAISTAFSTTTANTFSLLNTFANATSTLFTSTTAWIDTLNLTNDLTVANGGTGASTFGQGWLYSAGGTTALAASTSPTVNYLTATSTTATSTFAYAIQATAGYFTTFLRVANDIVSDITGFGLAITSGALGLDTTGAADEECLTYESTGPTTEWQTCGGASTTASGSYTGDGTANKAIAHGLGAIPRFVTITPRNHAGGEFISTIFAHNPTYISPDVGATGRTVTTMSSTNFYVSTDNLGANTNTQVYDWIASI